MSLLVCLDASRHYLNETLFLQIANMGAYPKFSNEERRLQEHNKIHEEFIIVAANELRYSVQPILALSEFLLSKKGNIEQYKSNNIKMLHGVRDIFIYVNQTDISYHLQSH